MMAGGAGGVDKYQRDLQVAAKHARQFTLQSVDLGSGSGPLCPPVIAVTSSSST